MRKYCDAMNECLKELDLRDVVLLKICVCSFGIFLGLLLPKRCRKVMLLASLFLFTASCLPLLAKWIPALREACQGGE